MSFSPSPSAKRKIDTAVTQSSTKDKFYNSLGVTVTTKFTNHKKFQFKQ
jgi:hypothetical protein